jgi:hypothetical protein
MWFNILKIDTEGLPPGLQELIDEYENIKPDDTRTPFERSWDLARKTARRLDNMGIVKDEIHMRPPWLLKWLKTGQHRDWRGYWKDIMDGQINNFWMSFKLDTKSFCITLNFIYPVGEYFKDREHNAKGKLCLNPSTDYPMGDHYVSAMLSVNAGFEMFNSMW